MQLAVGFTIKITWSDAASGTRSARTSSQDSMKGRNPAQGCYRRACELCNDKWPLCSSPRYFISSFVKQLTLFFRFKPEMWSKVAEEMAVPWRAAEAMHWQLGEADMARRAGVVPFSLSSVTVDTPAPGHRTSPTRGHAHSQSHSSVISGTGSSSGSRYSRPTTSHSHSSSRGSGSNAGRTIAARRDSTPRSVPPASPSDGLALAAIGSGMPMGIGRGGQGGQMLPSVAEMTTGVSPYSTPAYTMSISMPMGGGYSSPGPLLPAIGSMGVGIRPDVKRRATPEIGPRETSRRRQ